MSEHLSYPNTPGHNDRETSVEAAAAIQPHVSRLAAEVLALVKAEPRTCYEIEQLGYSHQTASARIRELNLKGKVVDSGERRLTGSGRRAIVWKAAA